MFKFRKFITFITLLCFLISSVSINAYAYVPAQQILSGNKPFLQDTIISNAFGKITDKEFFDNSEIVVNIQDLHCDPQVQKNIASIIEEINNKYEISGIYAEGGYGSVSTGWAADIADKNDRQQLLDTLLNSGRITGSEYYSALTGKYNIIKGIENKDLHRQNIARLNEILSKQAYYASVIKTLEDDIFSMQVKYLRARNKRFDRTTKEFSNGKIDSKKYYALLGKYADSAEGVSLKKYPNISAFIKLGDIYGKLNYSKISKQLIVFTGLLKEFLTYSAYADILEKTDNFSNIEDLYFYAEQFVRQYGIDISKDFNELNLFFKYTKLEGDIDFAEMIAEEHNLSEDIRVSFSKDIEEVEVAFLSYFLLYFKRYLTADLTAQEYKYFVRKFDDFKYLLSKYSYENTLQALQEDFTLLDTYYKANASRDEIFLQHLALPAQNAANAEPLNLSSSEIQNKLKNLKVKVVVAGGFHSQGLTELLKQRQVSYISVMPNVKQASNAQSVYETLLKRQAYAINYGGETAQTYGTAGNNSLALALGSADAQVKYENGIYAVMINNEVLQITKNELTNRFEIIDTYGNNANGRQIEKNSLLTDTVKENIVSNIEMIRGLSSPLGGAEVIYWLVKEAAKS